MSNDRRIDRDLQELLAFEQAYLNYGKDLQQVAECLRRCVDEASLLLQDDVSVRVCGAARRSAAQLAGLGAEAEEQAGRGIRSVQAAMGRMDEQKKEAVKLEQEIFNG